MLCRYILILYHRRSALPHLMRAKDKGKRLRSKGKRKGENFPPLFFSSFPVSQSLRNVTLHTSLDKESTRGGWRRVERGGTTAGAPQRASHSKRLPLLRPKPDRFLRLFQAVPLQRFRKQFKIPAENLMQDPEIRNPFLETAVTFHFLPFRKIEP